MSSTKVKKIPLYKEEPIPFDWDKEITDRSSFYKKFLWLAKLLTNHEFETLTFIGEENVPQDGPFLMISNHVNGFDPITLMRGLSGRRSMYFMAKEDFYHAFYICYPLTWFGGFPVKRGVVDRNSMNFAKRVLQQGHSGLMVFPQGTRDRERTRPELESTKNGFAMLARDCKVPVVPCSIHLEKDLSKSHPKCIVRYGKPIPYEELGFTEGSKKKKELNAAAELMWKKVQELWDMDEM